MNSSVTKGPILDGRAVSELKVVDTLPANQPEEPVEDGLHIGRQLGIGLLMMLFITVITGIIYPLIITGVSQVAFPSQANGSIATTKDGRQVGSLLIGQVFTDTKYFYGRPSAGGIFNSDTSDPNADTVPGVSSGSNLGPTNTKLVMTTTLQAAEAIRATEGITGTVPADLATASGSGLDPHITPAAAHIQVARVAKARNMQPADLQKLVDQHTEGRDLGFLREPRVNVLKLNLALDAQGGGR